MMPCTQSDGLMEKCRASPRRRAALGPSHCSPTRGRQLVDVMRAVVRSLERAVLQPLLSVVCLNPPRTMYSW